MKDASIIHIVCDPDGKLVAVSLKRYRVIYDAITEDRDRRISWHDRTGHDGRTWKQLYRSGWRCSQLSVKGGDAAMK